MQVKFLDELVGNFITLRKIKIADAAEIYSWRSGMSGRYLRQPEGYSIASQEDWIRNRGNNEVNYIICDKTTMERVGTIGIYDVNNHDEVANIGRLLLSDKFLRKSTPYGLESLLLTYNYLFYDMNFRKITGDIMARNEDMFKLQKFLGMKQEGFLEKHTVVNGIPEDLYIMSLMKEDFPKYESKIKFLLNGFNKNLLVL